MHPALRRPDLEPPPFAMNASNSRAQRRSPTHACAPHRPSFASAPQPHTCMHTTASHLRAWLALRPPVPPPGARMPPRRHTSPALKSQIARRCVPCAGCACVRGTRGTRACPWACSGGQRGSVGGKH
eukprot:363545-Chlamydomonas_euryale.AAC.12